MTVRVVVSRAGVPEHVPQPGIAPGSRGAVGLAGGEGVGPVGRDLTVGRELTRPSLSTHHPATLPLPLLSPLLLVQTVVEVSEGSDDVMDVLLSDARELCVVHLVTVGLAVVESLQDHVVGGGGRGGRSLQLHLNKFVTIPISRLSIQISSFSLKISKVLKRVETSPSQLGSCFTSNSVLTRWWL